MNIKPTLAAAAAALTLSISGAAVAATSPWAASGPAASSEAPVQLALSSRLTLACYDDPNTGKRTITISKRLLAALSGSSYPITSGECSASPTDV